MELILYSTQDCHLCEQALNLFEQLEEAFELKSVDIAESEKLMEQYGVRIPVVKAETGNELGWPVDLTELRIFINENS